MGLPALEAWLASALATPWRAEKRLIRKIQRVWEGISKGVFIPNDLSWRCKTCPYIDMPIQLVKKIVMATTIVPPTYVTQSEEQYDQGVNPKNARRLFVFVRPYSRRLTLAVFLMLCASAASVAGPYLVGYAIDKGLGVGDAFILRNTLLVFLGVTVIQWVSTYYRVSIMASVLLGRITSDRSMTGRHN